jgi:hypothetical protein
MVRELQAMSPYYVIFADRDKREFRRPGFGVDYALAITEWIQQNYGKKKNEFRGR